jgi:hypothetical protein
MPLVAVCRLPELPLACPLRPKKARPRQGWELTYPSLGTSWTKSVQKRRIKEQGDSLPYMTPPHALPASMTLADDSAEKDR